VDPGEQRADIEGMPVAMSRFLRIVLVGLVLSAALVPGVSAARTTKGAPVPSVPIPQTSPSAQAAPATTATVPPRILNLLSGAALASGPPQSYALFVRGAERQTGLIDILRKDDEAYFDLGPDQLERTYIIAPAVAAGIGSPAFAGRVYSPLLVRFVRVGKRILWVEPNSKFVTPTDEAGLASLDVSVANSIISASPIVAEDARTKHVVIAASFLLTDIEGIGTELGLAAAAPTTVTDLFTIVAHPAFALDSTRSFIMRTKALPENDEILVNLTFSGPRGAVSAASDGRGVPIHMHYSIIGAPDDGYVPRLADDRVGYFITSRKRLDDTDRPSPFLRYIDRRNLAAGPQVFYLTKEIPPEYRDAVRRGILAWNQAFAKIGHPDAIEVKDAPNDPSWDPDDVRYSVVRWISSDDPTFGGMSMSLIDPRTGEILRSEIVIEGETVRAIKRGYFQMVAPTAFGAMPGSMAGCAGDDCGYARRFADQAALGTLMMRFGAATPPSPQRIESYTDDFVTSVVVHETGHALGLSHNFEAHAAFTLAQLRDPAFTQIHGISSSVMDYNAINLAPPGKPQGAFFQTKPGPYDMWAIAYGYKTVLPNVKDPGAELPLLHAIANQSSRPELRFATDDDANGIAALDPRIGPFQLSNDPIGFAIQNMQIDRTLTARLAHLGAKDAESYADERSTFLVIMNNSFESAVDAARYIGGMYVSRSHRGQPGAEPPFRVIPREVQRQAFRLVAAHVFAPDALAFPPRLLNELASDRFADSSTGRPDFPITRFAMQIQDVFLARLFKPLVMERLSDMEQKARPGQTMSLADLFEWSRNAIWDDAAAPAGGRITVVHRDLQRSYTDLMAEIALLPSGRMRQLNIPYDAQGLARHELEAIASTVAAGLRRGDLDLETRAHLEDVAVRVHDALTATSVRPL
jgi:hypothetical protein